MAPEDTRNLGKEKTDIKETKEALNIPVDSESCNAEEKVISRGILKDKMKDKMDLVSWLPGEEQTSEMHVCF